MLLLAGAGDGGGGGGGGHLVQELKQLVRFAPRPGAGVGSHRKLVMLHV